MLLGHRTTQIAPTALEQSTPITSENSRANIGFFLLVSFT